MFLPEDVDSAKTKYLGEAA